VKRSWTTLTIITGLWALAAASWPAEATDYYSEEAVKAAFLFRFGGYVDWPPAALAGAQFVIAVLDDEPVAAELARLVPNRTVAGRAVLVRPISNLKQLHDAQLLYIGPSHREELRTLIGAVSSRPVLVVTDEAGGLDAGATVNFMLIDQRVRFEISLDSATRSGLRIGSELLAVAIRVRGQHLRSIAECEPPSEDVLQTTCYLPVVQL
jgi:hypothetical protein